MKNKLSDLNNHLFMELERLNDEDLEPENLEFEVSRSKALTGVAKTIIKNASLALQAQKHFAEFGTKQNEMPEMLKLNGNKIGIGSGSEKTS
jgi:hypothetical protein